MSENQHPFPYEDILTLSRPASSRRSKLSGSDRAAQFAPFAALTGFEEAICETGRITEGQRELTDGEQTRLNAMLQTLAEKNISDSEVTILYFRQDTLKSGGAYASVSGTVKKIDPYEHTVTMSDGTHILMEDIYNIKGEIFNDLEKDFAIV